MFNHTLSIPDINNKNQILDINKKFEYTILLKLFEHSLGSYANLNIIYKKKLESFFLYPTFSVLVFFFNTHEIINKICSNLLKSSFIESRNQNYIIILVSDILNFSIYQNNSYDKNNNKLRILEIATLEILHYILLNSFYIHNNYKKYILEVLIKNNNFLNYFTFNKTTIVLIIRHIIKLFTFFNNKININILLDKFFFKNILLSEKNNKVFFFRGIILKKKSNINKFRKFTYSNIKIILLRFEKIFCGDKRLQSYKSLSNIIDKVRYTVIIQKLLTRFFYSLKRNKPIIILSNFKNNNFIKYISKKFGIIIETNFTLNTLFFLQTHMDSTIYDFTSNLNLSKSSTPVVRLNIINEKYKKWIFLTNFNNKFSVTLIGGFNKYFLFEYCISLLKSLISKIYNLLIDSRFSLDNGLLECTILHHINDVYSNNTKYIYYFPLVSIITKYFKYNKLNINTYFKNFKKNKLFNKSLIKFKYKNFSWTPANEKVL